MGFAEVQTGELRNEKMKNPATIALVIFIFPSGTFSAPFSSNDFYSQKKREGNFRLFSSS